MPSSKPFGLSCLRYIDILLASKPLLECAIKSHVKEVEEKQ
jgi:hypothetical protein